eukprot:9344594-Alexandrium_andersonii.AAC.1
MHGLHSRRPSLESADSVAEVLQLLVDGAVGIPQLLAVGEDLRLEALDSGDHLRLSVPDVLKLFRAGGEEGLHGSPGLADRAALRLELSPSL